MIGVVAKVRIREGKEARFEELFLKRADDVRANEPGCLLYQLTRSRSEPRTYKVLELFLSEADVAQNTNTEYFFASKDAFAACTDGPADVEYLDAVE